MKRVLKGLFILLFVIILSACTKNYKPITYTKFIETFKAEMDYLVNNESNIFDDRFERYIEASGKNNQFIFYEFKTEEAAREYVETNYKTDKEFKFKDKKEYIIVKSTKNRYFYLVQIDNIVLLGNTDIKSNKKEIMRIFKKLGY